MSEATSS